MSAEHVLTMLNEHEVKFVDLRFTEDRKSTRLNSSHTN